MPGPSSQTRSRVPLLVWVLVALNGALLWAYTLLFPPYTGFDEPQHVDMTLHAVRGELTPWPEPGTLPLSLEVARSSNPVYFGELAGQPFTLLQYPKRGERATIAELGDLGGRVNNYPNQMIQHPPAYYALSAVVLKAWPGSVEDMPYDRMVTWLRMLSVVLLTPLPLLFWLGVRRLAEPPIALMGAALSLGFPGVTRIGANVQNDALLVLASTALMVGLIRVVTGDLTRKTAVVVGLLTALALWSKGFALAFPPVVALAYLLHRKAGIRPGLWALGVGGLLGSPWYVANLVRFGTLQPEGLGPVASKEFFGPEDDKPHPLLDYVDQAGGYLNRRFWSSIGITDLPTIPPWVCWLLTLLLVSLLVVAFVRSTRRAALAVLLLPVVLLVGLLVAGSLRWWFWNGGLPGVQGRYLYPGLLGLVAVACLGARELLGRWQRFAPLLGFLFAGALQLMAIGIVFRDYWLPDLDVRTGIKGLLNWSPWPQNLSLVPFALTGVLAATALVLVVRAARSTEPEAAEA